MDGSLWWVIIITFLLLDDKSAMNAHLFGSLILLGSCHVFRKHVYAVYVEMTWNLTETHWNPHTSNLLNRHEHETEPNSGKATLSQYNSCSMPPYICNWPAVAFQDEIIHLSWKMTLQESSGLWFQIPIHCTRGDSFHHQFRQVLLSSSVLTRLPQTHFFSFSWRKRAGRAKSKLGWLLPEFGNFLIID